MTTTNVPRGPGAASRRLNYVAGNKAYWESKYYQDNPHPKGSQEWQDWANGHADGSQHKHKVKELLPVADYVGGTCSRCRFWGDGKEAGDVRQCHGGPPTAAIDSAGQGYWPMTSANDWCGAYKGRTGRPTGS